MATFERSENVDTIKTGMTEKRLPRLSLRERLGGLFSTAPNCEALPASALGSGGLRVVPGVPRNPPLGWI